MARYRVMNRITMEWWEGEALSAVRACRKAGWIIGDCWVRVQTLHKGWGKPGELKKGDRV